MPLRYGPLPRRTLLLCLALLFAPLAAAADPAAICERAIARAAQGSSVPQSVLHAISLTETGRPSGGRLRPWPWAVNREGRGHWFEDRDSALAFARQSIAEGRRSFDVSCFQINYHWHGHNFPSIEAMFDPDVAAAYAVRFLTELHAETGNWSVAAGAYHSRTPHFARIYRNRFDRILAGLGGQPLVVTAEAEAVEEDETGPRRSRVRMSRGPLIIRVTRDMQAGEGRIAQVRAHRLEKAVASDDPPAPEAAPAEVVLAAAEAEAAPWVAAAGPRTTGIQ